MEQLDLALGELFDLLGMAPMTVSPENPVMLAFDDIPVLLEATETEGIRCTALLDPGGALEETSTLKACLERGMLLFRELEIGVGVEAASGDLALQRQVHRSQLNGPYLAQELDVLVTQTERLRAFLKDGAQAGHDERHPAPPESPTSIRV